ncbi:MAG TPA: hypothetical protein VGQ56_20720 [Gemmatimonadaceae bacterium]|jgi:hypothetical protein|nr:hypothetical protein [Gemmatimonadaceae bacterium]
MIAYGATPLPIVQASPVWIRFGRVTSSPPQLGHTLFMVSAHAGHHVHSYEQMSASPSAMSAAPQRSHFVRISRGMARG